MIDSFVITNSWWLVFGSLRAPPTLSTRACLLGRVRTTKKHHEHCFEHMYEYTNLWPCFRFIAPAPAAVPPNKNLWTLWVLSQTLKLRRNMTEGRRYILYERLVVVEIRPLRNRLLLYCYQPLEVKSREVISARRQILRVLSA